MLRHSLGWGLVVMVACCLGGCTAPEGSDPLATGPGPSASGSESAGGGGSTGTGPSAVDGAGTGLPGGFPQASWTTTMDPPPPLARYAVYMDGPRSDPAAVEARQEWYGDVENAKAECMAEQGFRYSPNPPDASQPVGGGSMASRLSSLPVPLLPDSRETVVRVGYGVMATPEEQAVAAGADDDPNRVYRESLSAAEAAAYDLALLGDYNDPAGSFADSCAGKAQAQYPEPTTRDRDQVFDEEFGGLIMAARGSVRVDAGASASGLGPDPRRLQLDDAWEACMTGKGYRLERIEGDHGPMLSMSLVVRTHPDGTVG